MAADCTSVAGGCASERDDACWDCPELRWPACTLPTSTERVQGCMGLLLENGTLSAVTNGCRAGVLWLLKPAKGRWSSEGWLNMDLAG